jgi:hypothetical protein
VTALYFGGNMEFIANRGFLVVTPKKPMVGWVNGYDDNPVEEDVILTNNTLYMIEDLDNDSPETIEKYLKVNFKDIFISELEGWYTDEDYFPEKMSFRLFKEWFSYTYIDMCFDTLDGEEIEKE